MNQTINSYNTVETTSNVKTGIEYILTNDLYWKVDYDSNEVLAINQIETSNNNSAVIIVCKEPLLDYFDKLGYGIKDLDFDNLCSFKLVKNGVDQ